MLNTEWPWPTPPDPAVEKTKTTMNIKVLSPIDTGFAKYQPGDLATLPDAAALACIKSGAAAPADRRAQRIVAEANAAEQAALALAMAAAELNNPDKRPREKGGFLVNIQAINPNLRPRESGKPGRFDGI